VDLDGLDWWSWSDYIITRGTTNFIVGAADAVSFGIAGYNAETYGISKGIVDYRSGAYFGGAITGSVGMVAGPAVVAYRGAAGPAERQLKLPVRRKPQQVFAELASPLEKQSERVRQLA
jgi:hypothetical protein